MSRYLFFLIVLAVPFLSVNAETGKNFDTVQNPDGTVTWTSHYERIWDGDSWENYIINQNTAKLRIETANIIYEFDKLNCDFKLYDPVTKELSIQSFKSDFLIDGIKQVLPVCPITNLTQAPDVITFNVQRGATFLTHFVISPIGNVEWTYEIKSTKPGNSILGIEESCIGCIANSINGDVIDFGSYLFDAKNEIHNTLKGTNQIGSDFRISYEKTMPQNTTLEIDPIFGYTAGTARRIVSTSTLAAACSTTASSIDGIQRIYKEDSGTNQACTYMAWYWNVSTIPDAATIYDVDLLVDVDVATNPENCDINPMTVNPSTATGQQILDDILDGTPYLDNDSWCTTLGNNKSFDLGGSAETDVDTALVDNEYAIGIFYQTLTRNGVDHQTDFSDVRLRVIYDTPGAVTDLISTDIRPTSVDLDWSQPDLRGQTLSGYQINFTTPWSSNVASISNNNSGTSTAATVSGLSGNTQYSFRIGVWTANGGFNGSGNILNITTDIDPTVSFTPGTFNLTGTGEDIRDIIFQRNDINANDMWLNITVDTDWDLACDIHYKFANTNQTYTNIANTTIDSETDAVAFRFNNVENEVIDVFCWDQYNLDNEGRFVITQVNFPLLEQVANFTGGVYGTQGMFGSLDFITIIVVIISMVGFNRNNELVGIILSMFLIGGIAVLSAGQIISWGPTLTAVFALIIMWGVGTMRKN